MFEYLQAHEATVRLAVFAGLLLALFLLERLWPRRDAGGLGRVGVNLLLVGFNTLLMRLCFPVLAVGVAVWAQSRGAGFFNAQDWPMGLEILLAVLLLDMIIYWQHRIFHAVPWLWRLHRVHHSDLGFDVSTGVRFHPVEIMLSMLIKMAVVLVLGADPLAVIVFEILLSASSLFEHANLRLPVAIDRLLRIFIVTPDMHRVHHSVYRQETDSNFGFNLSIWDRIFRSYHAQPRDGHDHMRIGLPVFREQQDQKLLSLLIQPIKKVPPQ